VSEELEKLRKERKDLRSIIEKARHGRSQVPPEEQEEIKEAKDCIRAIDKRIDELTGTNS
jgi:hypothetical protein